MKKNTKSLKTPSAGKLKCLFIVNPHGQFPGLGTQVLRFFCCWLTADNNIWGLQASCPVWMYHPVTAETYFILCEQVEITAWRFCSVLGFISFKARSPTLFSQQHWTPKFKGGEDKRKGEDAETWDRSPLFPTSPWTGCSPVVTELQAQMVPALQFVLLRLPAGNTGGTPGNRRQEVVEDWNQCVFCHALLPK